MKLAENVVWNGGIHIVEILVFKKDQAVKCKHVFYLFKIYCIYTLNILCFSTNEITRSIINVRLCTFTIYTCNFQTRSFPNWNSIHKSGKSNPEGQNKRTRNQNHFTVRHFLKNITECNYAWQLKPFNTFLSLISWYLYILDTYTGRWKQNMREYSDEMDIKKRKNDLEEENKRL